MRLDVVDLVAIIVFLIGVGLLRWRLPPAQERYTQWWAPLLAALFASTIGFVIWHVSGWRPWEAVRDGLAAIGVLGLFSLLADFGPVAAVGVFLADAGLADALRRLGQIINQSLNLSILLLYLPLRALFALVMARVLKPTLGRPPPQLFFGHDSDGEVKVLSHWQMSQRLFRTLAFVAFGLAILQVVGITARLPLGFGTGWPVLSFLLLAELAWFLGADLLAKQPREAETPREAESEPRELDVSVLKRRYEKMWPAWLLAAGALEPRGPKAAQNTARTEDVPLGHGEACRLTSAALVAGESVLLEDVLPHQIEACLQDQLRNVLDRQQRVLVLVAREDQVATARTWLQTSLQGVADARVDDIVSALASKPDDGPDVVVATIEDEPVRMLEPSAYPWARSFSFLIVLDVHATLLWHGPEAAAVVRAMRDVTGVLPQMLALGDWRVNSDAAVANITGLKPRHIQVQTRPLECQYMVWRVDAPPSERGRSFFQALFRSDIQGFVTNEAALAYLAEANPDARALLLHQDGLPWLRAREVAEDARRVAQIDPEYESVSIEGVPVAASDWPIPARENRSIAVPIARDTSANLVGAVRKWASVGATTLVHAVAPDYLLRDYFTDRFDELIEHRRSFSALAPDFGNGRRFALYQLFRRLERDFVPVREIDRVLDGFQAADASTNQTRGRRLRDLLMDRLQLRAPMFEYRLEHRFEPNVKPNGRFVPELAMRMHSSTRDDPPDWHQVYSIEGPDAKTGPARTLARYYRGHLDQNVLPGQVHAYGGRAYEIGPISDRTTSVDASVVDLTGYVARYRQHRRYRVDWTGVQQRELVQNAARTPTVRLELTRFDAPVTRSTLGYFAFESRDGVDLTLDRYVDLSRSDTSGAVVERAYPHTDVLRARLVRSDGAPVDEDVRFTLALLLGEMMPSYLPEAHQYLGVCLPAAAAGATGDGLGEPDTGTERDDSSERAFGVTGALDRLVPRLDGLPDDEAHDPDGHVTLYLVEDSPFEIGLVAALMRKLDNVIDDLREYLEWWERNPDKATYLRFGGDRIPPSLRLDEALDFLRPFRGTGPQHYDDVGDPGQRRGDVESGTFLDEGGNECSFCGRGFEPHALETFDKRLRCKDCAAEAVDTMSELKALYRHARKTFEKRHGVTLPTRIEVRFTDAGEVLEGLGQPVGPTIRGANRYVGFARHHDGRYQIYLENGHARHNVQATIVHELAHIWQFANLPTVMDDKELIEGHAVWVAIDYLHYLRYPHLESFRAHFLTRDDVYGLGYRRVIAEMGASKLKDAFELLRSVARERERSHATP